MPKICEGLVFANADLTWRTNMKRISSKTNCALAFAVAGMLAAGPVAAQKPDWAGGDKGGKSGRMEKSEDNKAGRRDDDGRSSRNRGDSSVRMGQYFGDQHRTITRDHYSEQFRGGRCPPGLAKKNNGCMPPGQAKKWSVGRPLPRDVIYYDVPPYLVTQYGRPPSGHRYVRVASDILLIALGTGMVIDAIQDLGRM
jgi:Ni/Co efflux regulator RcnB